MENVDVLIVGGGPAGSTCAWKLRDAGREVVVLDKQDFPRSKPCAGWITPAVVRDLHLDFGQYPLTYSRFDHLRLHFRGRLFSLPTLQFAIRRVEFDNWLLNRAGVPVVRHAVASIAKDGERFVVDDMYRCRCLVGAGGTHCPVYRNIFQATRVRPRESQITAVEAEFPAGKVEGGCHLWFPRDLPGYSWYVPKGRAHMNIGVGGKTSSMQSSGKTIRSYWEDLIRILGDRSFLTELPGEPMGHIYYLRHDSGSVQLDNAYLVGDAAGLATKDFGEGIGPAVRSGILAAEAIIRGTRYSLRSIAKYSALDLVFPRARRLLAG